MNPQSRRKQNRRYEEEEEELGMFQVAQRMAMPAFYILGIICGCIGAICNGVIAQYWANLEYPMCYLYSETASAQIFYKFGGSLSVCTWVTYSAVTAIIIAFFTGLLYVIKGRPSKEVDWSMALCVVGIILAFAFMLASVCTLAEGMRRTCISMGLNSSNNKGSSCYDKLDYRVSQYMLPVETSMMVRTAMINLSVSAGILFIIGIFHISSCYRRAHRNGENDY